MPTSAEPAVSRDTSSPGTAMRRLLIAVLGAAFLWCAISMFRAPYRFPVDDAFFYLVIANNFAHGLGSTFTGIGVTNGYHPLWMLLIALVSWVSPLGKAALIYEVCALQFCLMLFGIAIVFKIYKGSFFHSAWAVVIFEVIFLGKGTLSLMEIWLAAPLLLLAIFFLQRLQDAPSQAARTRLLLGVTLMACSLARLELTLTSLFFWVAAIAITHNSQQPGIETSVKAKTWFRAVIVSLPGMILTPAAIIAYMVVNRIYFESATPISGRIKSSFPHPHFQLSGFIGLFLFAVLVIGLAAGFIAARKPRKLASMPSALSLALIALWCGLAASLTYDVLFSFPSQWYFVAGYTFIILGLPLLLGSAIGKRRSLHVAGICALAIVACALNWLRGSTNFVINPQLVSQAGTLRRVSEIPGYSVGLQLNSMLPPQSGLLVRDAPGILAYYTDLRVFPADGLVAPDTYSSDVVKEGALAYFCKHNIRYVLSPDPTPGHPFLRGALQERMENGRIVFTVYAPVGLKPAGGWTVPDAPIRVFPEISIQYRELFPTVSLREIPCGQYAAVSHSTR
ncbi:MAG: hypothetical protein ACRD3N_19195 [Terracidiphilus sp.]